MQKCPKCEKEECYVETQNDVVSYVCFSCGYYTKSTNAIKNLQFQSELIMMDADMKKMVWRCPKDLLYWYPITFQIPGEGVLYPEGDVNNLHWVYMPMIGLTEKEQRMNPGMKEKPDIYRKKIYTSENLKEALKLLKVIE